MPPKSVLPQWFDTLLELDVAFSTEQHCYLEYLESLTELLRHKTNNRVCFTHNASAKQPLTACDAQYLQQPVDSDCLRRVILWSFEYRLWIYAESIIPVITMPYLPHGGAGPAPLGEVLFADAHIERSTLQYALITPVHGLYQRACHYQALPSSVALVARRRRFMVEAQYPLMIIEVFFPQCLLELARC